MVLCQMSSIIAPSTVRSELKKKAKIHRAYFNHLSNAGGSFRLNSLP